MYKDSFPKQNLQLKMLKKELYCTGCMSHNVDNIELMIFYIRPNVWIYFSNFKTLAEKLILQNSFHILP